MSADRTIAAELARVSAASLDRVLAAICDDIVDLADTIASECVPRVATGDLRAMVASVVVKRLKSRPLRFPYLDDNVSRALTERTFVRRFGLAVLDATSAKGTTDA